MRHYLKQRKGIWYICWTDKGLPRRVTTGERDRPAAEKALARHVLSDPGKQSVELLRDVMLRWFTQHGSTLASADMARYAIGDVEAYLQGVRALDVEGDTLARFVGQLRTDGLSDSSIHRRLGIIQAAINWAHRRKELPATVKIQKPAESNGDGARPATVDELRTLFAGAKLEHHRRFLLLMLATCGRPSAVLDLTWDRISKDTRTADLHNPARKRNKKVRPIVPLASVASQWLEARRGLGPVVQWKGKPLKDYATMFQTILDDAGVSGISPYSLRKAAGTWMRRKKVGEPDIMGMLGHKLGRGITSRYAHFDPDYMRDAADAIDALLVEICPPWLANALPVPAAPVSPNLQMPVAVGDFGGRTWDRTTDPYHVKAELEAQIQLLRVANDD
jgi:integrase